MAKKQPQNRGECDRLSRELSETNARLIRAEEDAKFWESRVDEWCQRCAVLEWMLEKTLAIVTNTRQPEFPHAEFRNDF